MYFIIEDYYMYCTHRGRSENYQINSSSAVSDKPLHLKPNTVSNISEAYWDSLVLTVGLVTTIRSLVWTGIVSWWVGVVANTIAVMTSVLLAVVHRVIIMSIRFSIWTLAVSGSISFMVIVVVPVAV